MQIFCKDIMIQRSRIIRRPAVWRVAGLAAAAVLSCALVAPALATPTDAWLTTKVKLALLTTENVSGTAISVDTINRQVTLHGKVRSVGEAEKAETVAKAIDGVQGVRNLLQVVATDADFKDIGIEVKNRVVRLTGTVPTGIERLEAMQIARATAGVSSVHDDLRLAD
jgi:osmotically-inducible protein OsmY